MFVRPHLQTIQQLDHGLLPPTAELDPDGILLVNARVAPCVAVHAVLKELAGCKESTVISDAEDDVVLAAKLSAADLHADAKSQTQFNGFAGSLACSGDRGKTFESFRERFSLAASRHRESYGRNARSNGVAFAKGGYKESADGVFVKAGTSVGQYASVDCSDGPILLDENVQVGPFCFLSGPVYAGPNTRVIEHAALKDGVALGHTVKIGGEVVASVIEPFTNKQHHGFLGHSYLGSWINLGAGTCNSDMKNTYGKINMQYGDVKVSTGMQFIRMRDRRLLQDGDQHQYLYWQSDWCLQACCMGLRHRMCRASSITLVCSARRLHCLQT